MTPETDRADARDEDILAKQASLTMKQERFCEQIAAIGTDCFGNASMSAETAGYSKASAYSQGKRLLKQDKIRARIAALQADHLARNAITADSVLLGLEDLRQRAVKADQLAVAKGCLELEGKWLGLFADRHVFERGPDTPLASPEHQKMLMDICAEYRRRIEGDDVPKFKAKEVESTIVAEQEGRFVLPEDGPQDRSGKPVLDTQTDA